ncbi:unnamed protein product [Anisakis simplex]|uniref:Secreted protein n=1 Tax=Anisakis simplex TaxID=6269 RepID=A0A0M3K9N5_ANISI|nr:unnamed protein product [Anisakis simplex]
MLLFLLLVSLFSVASLTPVYDEPPTEMTSNNDGDEDASVWWSPSFSIFQKRDIEHELYNGPYDASSLFLSLPRTDRKPTFSDLLRLPIE